MNTGVIFDFDGVLVDSLNQLVGLYVSISNKFNTTNSNVEYVSDFEILNGKNIKEISEYIGVKYKSDVTSKEIEYYYKEQLLKLYGDLEINESWINIIGVLKKENINISIASGCDTDLILIVLKNNGIESFFDAVVGGDQVSKSKPSPDLVIKCLEQSQWDRAVMIDDSSNGVVAGLLASCRVIKYDAASKVNIYELIKYTLSHEYSYFGELNNFSIELQNDVFNEYSELDENTWNKLKKEGTHNGDVFLVDPISLISNDNVKLHKSDYKSFRLGVELPISAVTGVVMHEDGSTLCAKRSHLNFQNKGAWDLVPSGTLSTSNFKMQLDIEWKEESSSNIVLEWGDKCHLIFDHKDNVIDFV